MNNEIILCKFGEVVLKGLNRSRFESSMIHDLRRRLSTAGNYTVTYGQSVAFIEGADERADMDEAARLAATVFGFNAISRAVAAEKTLPGIEEAVKTKLRPYLAGKKTFKCEAKRGDKNFPLSSPALSAAVGGMILAAMPHLRVDVHHPEVVVHIEIRDRAYLHAGSTPGAGGVPSAGNGKSLLLLSGGIDSPVAGYMMARRGSGIEALHFESFPYTSERAREKVFDLARRITVYTGGMRVHVLSLTKIQETMVAACDESYFTLLLRRFMMRLACRLAAARGCEALITGESLGQVASQTLRALTVTDEVCDRPVFRPCIGMDKEEIVRLARQIDTFETSALPFEDCCTVFTPKHPKTRPDLCKVLAEEQKLDVRALEDEAMASLKTHFVSAYGD